MLVVIIMSKRSYIYTGTVCSKLNRLSNLTASFLTRKAEIDEEGVKKIKEYSEKGSVVYCSYQSSNFALLFLYKLLKRNNISTPEFALEYNPIMLQNFTQVLKRVFQWIKRNIFRKKHADAFESGYIDALINKDTPVLFPLLSQKFFLKRYLETKYDSLLYLIELQKKREKPIFLFPQMIFWNRNPERSTALMKSKATGNRGLFRALITTATPSYIRVLNPFDMKAFISENEDKTSYELAVLLRDQLLEAYQHEKRIIIGPVLRSKSEMMEKILYHPNVLKQINELSEGNQKKQKKLKKKAFKYYKEIAADFKVRYVHFWEVVLDWMFRKIFSGIRYDKAQLEKIREASTKGTLVFVPCHRSHMDYLILSYIFYKNKFTPPHIAAGVNLSFFPVGKIFRHSGAFFIRRTFKGLDLYPYVFKQYLKTLVHEYYSIEFFIEGGRTRTGRLVKPKLGMMNYLVEAIEEGYNEDMVFIPISINYDRVLEENSYVKELKGKSKKNESVGGVLKNVKMLKRDYGHVYVNIGEYFSLKDIKNENVENVSSVAADKVIKHINRVSGINRISLVTSAMLFMSNKGFSFRNLKAMTEELFKYFTYTGMDHTVTELHENEINSYVDYTIESYKKDGIIEEVSLEDEGETFKDTLYRLREENRAGIAFYKNTALHHILPLSLISLILLKSEGSVSIQDLKSNYDKYIELLSFEFIFDDYHDFSFAKTEGALKYLVDNAIVIEKEDAFTIVEDRKNIVSFFSRGVSDIIESYYIVFKLLGKINRKMINEKDLIMEIRKYGIRQYHTEKIRAAESLSMPNYKTAIKKLIEMGVLNKEGRNFKNQKYKIENNENLDNMVVFLRNSVNR